MSKYVKTWEILTNQIVTDWISKSFEIPKKEIQFDWVVDEIGGVFNFADYYINFSDVYYCVKHSIDKDTFFKWYDYCLEHHKVNISLARFILDPQELQAQREKELKELEQRVELAKREFEKALKEYIDEK